MDRVSLTILMLINVPMVLGLGRLFFTTWKEFWDGLKLIYQHRNQFSLFGWDNFEEGLREAKAFCYVLCCVVLVFGQYLYFTR